MEINNTIIIEGNIFFKVNMRGIKFIKLIPCYDVEHGVVLKMICPPDSSTVLDKSWINIEIDSNNEVFKFRCPAFLSGNIPSPISVYEDSLHGEICRIRKIGSDFSNIKHLIKIPRKAIYEPNFSSDGKFHISLAYVRNNFINEAKKNPCAKFSNIELAVINKEIMVYVFSERNLDKNEVAFKLTRSDYELSTRPINSLVKSLGKKIANFRYQKFSTQNDVMSMHMKEGKIHAGHKPRIGRLVCGIRERVRGVRIERDRAS